MNTKNEHRMSYRSMIILALVAGGLGIVLQLIPDGELLAFMLSVAVLGGLIGGSDAYNERDRQLLRQSYKTAYEWLLLAIMIAYAFIVFSRWLNLIEGLAGFLNGHWPGLVISTMCLFMGIAGFQGIRSE